MKEKFKFGVVMPVSDAIKDVRVERNLKQEDVAELVGVSVQTYSKWESGKTEPKASQIIELAEILNTTTDRLLFNKEDSSLDTQLKERFHKVSKLRPRQKAIILDLLDSYYFRYTIQESFPSDLYELDSEEAKSVYKQDMMEVISNEQIIDDLVEKEISNQSIREKIRKSKNEIITRQFKRQDPDV